MKIKSETNTETNKNKTDANLLWKANCSSEKEENHSNLLQTSALMCCHRNRLWSEQQQTTSFLHIILISEFS